MTNGYLCARHADVDTNVERFTPLVMSMRRLHDDATTHDAREIAIQPGRFLVDSCSDSGGRLHVPISDLNWCDHKINGCQIFVLRFVAVDGRAVDQRVIDVVPGATV